MTGQMVTKTNKLKIISKFQTKNDIHNNLLGFLFVFSTGQKQQNYRKNMRMTAAKTVAVREMVSDCWGRQ